MSTRLSLFALVVALVVATAVAPFSAGMAAAAETGGCSFPVSETDATGTSVTVSERPDSIVTLNPSAAQTIYEISASDDPAWDRVVGVSQFADYLPGASAKTTVGNGNSDATVERTIALEPDLVLAPQTVQPSTISQLRDAGLTVYKFRDTTALRGSVSADETTVVDKTRLTGRLVGECDGAEDTADSMEDQLDIVRDALRDEERPKGMYYFFTFTAGSDTFIDEIMTSAGVENVAANADDGFFILSAETIVAENPEWVLLNGDQYTEPTVPAGPNGAFTETPASENGNAIVLDANEISQPAPRVMNALLDIVQAVHPEAYDEEIRDRLDRSEELGGAKQVRSTTTADGRVQLEARNLGRDRQVSFAVPPQANSTTQLQRVNVSLATVNPSFTIDLRYDDAGPAPLNGTHEFSRFSLETNGLPDEDVDRFRFRFGVNESALAARNASAENVTLYHHNGTEWRALDTRTVEQANGSVVFGATSPGASTFAIGAPESEAAGVITATPTPERTTTQAPEPTPTTTEPTPTATPAPTTAAATSTSTPGFGFSVALAGLSLVILHSLLRVRVRD